MATQKSPIRKGERIEQGVTTEDKGVFIPVEKREPYDPENLHRSKAQFIEAQRVKKEKALKLEAYSKQLDAEKEQKMKELETEEAPAPEAPIEPKKKKGRPKKS